MKPIPPLKKAGGDLLPLMDMIFLLLVMFIFMIIQMRPNFGISIELPNVGEQAPMDQPEEEKEIVTISVTSDNKIYINEEQVTHENLVSAIEKHGGSDSSGIPNIILRGDQNADYGGIIDIFTILRQNEINNILFDVERKDDGQPEK